MSRRIGDVLAATPLALTALLVALKALGVITVPWVWVFAPMWITGLVVLAGMVLLAIVVAVVIDL